MPSAGNAASLFPGPLVAKPQRKGNHYVLHMTVMEKQVVGSLFGSANPRFDIPRLLRLHADGQLKLEELVTHTYSLEEINLGYDDMRRGRNLRGVIAFG